MPADDERKVSDVRMLQKIEVKFPEEMQHVKSVYLVEKNIIAYNKDNEPNKELTVYVDINHFLENDGNK